MICDIKAKIGKCFVVIIINPLSKHDLVAVVKSTSVNVVIMFPKVPTTRLNPIKVAQYALSTAMVYRAVYPAVVVGNGGKYGG